MHTHLAVSLILLSTHLIHCKEVRFANFLSSGFITAIVVNPPERKLAKRTSVQWPTEWAQKFKFLQNSCRGK